MGTFSIAFDIIVVGALAIPWVLLVFHLFFSDRESSVVTLLAWLNKWVIEKDQAALAGVLLFAMAYPLGSVVSRIAQDFFDDDDLHLQVLGRVYRVGVTESTIRAEVYCEQQLLIPQTLIDSLKVGSEPFGVDECSYTRTWQVLPIYESKIKDQNERAGDIFFVQEGAILLRGTDQTERLRQFRDQIMVLRGAAFNGLLAFSLCLFWWSAKFQSRLRWVALSPYLLTGLVALYHHLSERAASDPPYMEFTLLVLATAGGYVLWHPKPNPKDAQGKDVAHNGRGEIRAAYLILSVFLALTVFQGWWATQVLYDKQVIYSYRAMGEQPTK
jgi:hypothetical protein